MHGFARVALVAAMVGFCSCSQETLKSLQAEAKAAQRSDALFSNSGFETGNLNDWTLTTALAAQTPGIQSYPVTTESQLGLRVGGTARTYVRQGLTPYSQIPAGLTAAEGARYPRYGTWSAVVNETGSGYNVNRLRQSSVVTTADIDPADGLVHVRFVVLPVLQNPGHLVREQPYYYVSIANTTKGTTLASRFNFSNEAGVPWQSNAGGSVVYTDWLLFDLPMSRAAVSIGDTLTATIIAGGCAQGGHWGEAIIDSFGSSIPGLVVYGSGPDSVEAGADFQYVYRVLNGATTASTGTKLTAYLPAGTTFRSVDTPGVTCTTPTVGTRGTVTCELGAVSAGASSIVRVTARADATATGTIRHGWYFSQSNQEQPLTGPLISTAVTTGSTTQYVDLSTVVDNGVSGVTWGQQLINWSITVENRGPSTATNAVITSNAPAQLMNLTWTCTGLGGASCGAATGSGALATTATIPSGGRAIYVLTADVTAGSGTGIVSVTASAAAAGGAVESFALDNGSGDDDALSGSASNVLVARAGAGSGSIVSSPRGVTCGPSCSSINGVFADGTEVTLHAIPAPGSLFAGWSGGTCTGSGACTFTVTSGLSATATFNENPVAITSPSTAKGAVGRAFSFKVTASGTAPVTLGATNLPSWLSFDSGTGLLTGTPSASSSYTVDLSATDVSGTATQQLVITTGVAPTITSALTYTLASAGSSWAAVDVNASGATPMQFNASNLPGTVYFNSTTGTFAGSAGVTGVFNVPVVANNAFGSDYKVIAVSIGGAPVITSALTGTGVVGTPYTYTLTATGTAPMTLNATSLPSWASFNASTGEISGTPTSAGTLSIGLSATNATGSSSQTLSLTIDGPAVITSALSAGGTAGQLFTYSLTAEGTAPITRSMTGVPAWASFDVGSGLLSGTPPAQGVFTITLGAVNGIGSDSKTLTVTIAAPPPTPTPPVITSALTASGVVGQAFSYSITATGQVPMTFSATGLPAWASLDTNTGVISGTPSVGGSVSISMTATNGLGADTKSLTLSISSPPAITSSLAESAVAGQAFSYTLTALGTAPVTFSASSVPAWASFDAMTGVLSGTPTAEGSSSVGFTATNAAGSDSETLVITVRTVPSITSALTATATVGVGFSYTVTSSGTAPVTLSASGLPGWASFNASTGVISGTPTSDGTLTISLGAVNAAGSDSESLVITVRAVPAITSPLTADAVVGQSFSYTLTASGTAPLTLSASSLPAWASFNASSGVLSGTPTDEGPVSIALGASNAAGSDSESLVITVRTVPVITSSLAASAVVGQPFSYTLTSSGTAPLTLSASALPTWASFNASSGVISGTPSAEGSFSVSLGATNGAGSDAETLVIVARVVPAITSALAADAVVGQAFSYTLTASGTAPVTLTASGLPSWASFNASTGVISGTPSAASFVSVSIAASNTAGIASQTLNITVRSLPTIDSALTADAVAGLAFSYTLTASGTAPLTLSASGLPSWASFNPSTGVISGTPTTAGPFSIALGASNAAGADTETLIITVRALPSITSALSAQAAVGAVFTYALTASGTGPVVLSVNDVPSWASFNAQTGVLSGTAPADGVITVTLHASNAAGSDTETLVITVRAMPIITSSLSVEATVGVPFSYTLTATGTAPTLAASQLPPWAHFDALTGVLSGTPTVEGLLSVNVQASNPAGTDKQVLQVLVRERPAITSSLVADAIVGKAFVSQLSLTGSEPMTVQATGLPSWLSFDGNTRQFSGIAPGDETVSVVITVTNDAGSVTRTLVVTARTAPRITNVLLAYAVVGRPFSLKLTATGTDPLVFGATSVPRGLLLTGDVLSGVPFSAGRFVIIESVQNAVTTESAALVLEVRAELPAPLIVSPVEAARVGARTVSLSGTAPQSEVGGRVRISSSRTLACEAVIQAGGLWTCSATFAEGPVELSAIIVDVNGFEGTVVDTQRFVVDVTAPVAPSWLGPVAGEHLPTPTPLLSGLGEPGAEVTVTHLGVLVCRATVALDGGWSCTPGALPEGPVALEVEQLDLAGNESVSVSRSFVIDVTAPVLPVVSQPLANALLATSTPTLTGTAEPGSAVVISIDGRVHCTTIASALGQWRCEASQLGEGAHTARVTSRDAAGNERESVAVPFSLDTIAPGLPTLAAPMAGSRFTVRTVELSGTADAGSTVFVVIDGRLSCTTTADSLGTWRCNASMLADGDHFVTITSRDQAGNERAAAPTRFVVDGTKPNAPVILGPTGRITATTPKVSGRAEPFSAVTVKLDDVQLCVTEADGDGNWSCSVIEALAVGPYRLSVTAKDASGNVSDVVTGSFEVETSRGSVEMPTESSSTENPALSGNATPGATVNVYVDDQLVGSTTADENGHWAYDLPRMDAGERRVSIGVTGSDGGEVYRSPDQLLTVTRPSVDFGGGLSCSSTPGSPLGLLMLMALAVVLRRRVRQVAAVAVVASVGVAQAQSTSGFEVEQLQLNPGARGGLVVGGSDLLQHRDYRVSASFGYQHAPLQYFEDGVKRATLIDHRVTAWLSGSYAVLPWLEVGANLPVVLTQSGQSVRTRLNEVVVPGVANGAALGTPWLQGRVGFLQERTGAPIDLGVTVMLGLPIGSVEGFTRDRTVSGQLHVGAGRIVGPVRLAAEVGALVRPGGALPSAPEDVIGSRLMLGLAVSTLQGPLRGEVSVRGFAPLTAQPASVEVLGGARYALKDFEVFALAGPGFGNAPGTPAFRALLGVSFGGLTSARCSGRSHVAADCPDLDFDGDGVSNAADWCPEKAGGTSEDGCPRPKVVTVPAPVAVTPPADADADGVPDASDACPDVAGSLSSGCAPEPVAVAVAEVVTEHAALKAGRIELKGAVYFETSKAVLQARSFPLLDEVVTVMKAHPEVVKVRIEGHTDDRGGQAFNQPLSEARAKSVKAYLERGGIASERLEAMGFGQSKPLVPNATTEGREQNRRVEFIVLP